MPGVERIKFITSFPNDMTDDLLQAVRDLPRVSRYLHVPAQSGCDEVLRRMKRMYTVGFYEDMLARIRETIPGVAVSSDFIVGFCGETEESFERTVGPGRAGPVQEQLHLQVQPAAGDEGRRRCSRRCARGGQEAAEQRAPGGPDGDQPGGQPRLIGREMTVLVEGPSRSTTRREGWDGVDQLTGRTACDRIVVFDGHERLVGRDGRRSGSRTPAR